MNNLASCILFSSFRDANTICLTCYFCSQYVPWMGGDLIRKDTEREGTGVVS